MFHTVTLLTHSTSVNATKRTKNPVLSVRSRRLQDRMKMTMLSANRVRMESNVSKKIVLRYIATRRYSGAALTVNRLKWQKNKTACQRMSVFTPDNFKQALDQ